MKTQVIHLESYDDRHSILDRLNWGQADRIILVWPLRGTPLDHKLDLKLIHRRCQESRVSLALVCKYAPVVDEAHALGIPVFRSLRQAHKVAWEYSLAPYLPPTKPERKYNRAELAEMRLQANPPDWMTLPVTRNIAFWTAIFAILVMAFFLVPGATIEFLPKFKTQQLDLTLKANPQIDSYNLSGTIPSRRLTISVEGRSETTPSGQTSIPDQAAVGLIIFTNLTDQEISIPAGTIIRTADPNTSIRFATSTNAIIEAKAGAVIQVPVEAVNPGINSNLPSNSLVIIEGDLTRSLTAVNPDPTTGGTVRISASPSPEDYASLREELLISLWDTALDEARQTLAEKDVILDTSPRQVAILEESFSPPEPEPSSSLTLILRVEYELLYLSWEDLSAMGNDILDATLPDGFQAQPDTLQIEPLSPPIFVDSDQAEWEISISRRTFENGQLQPSIRQILGKKPDQAAKFLEKELDLTTLPEITLFPEWWPLMPLLEIRIEALDRLQN
ncbi:MAG: baseplate J/gp47 family protein [Anaerolineales bacterium]|nr:baseplate J/gp47 family protein [Anaerolineales bacterium]